MFVNVLEMSSDNAAASGAAPHNYAINETPSTSSNGGGDAQPCGLFAASTSSASAVVSERCTIGPRYSDSDSDFECDYRTPVKRIRRTVSVHSDSGCGTGACSSTSPYVKKNNKSRSIGNNHHHQQECSGSDALYNNNSEQRERDSDDEYNYEKFKKRVNKARINIRKQIGADSDSNWGRFVSFLFDRSGDVCVCVIQTFKYVRCVCQHERVALDNETAELSSWFWKQNVWLTDGVFFFATPPLYIRFLVDF